MSQVFHYTTVESAIQIVNSGSLFASHVRYLNDSLEFDFAKKQATHAVEERAKVELPYLKTNNKLTGGLVDKYPNSEVLIESITQPLRALSTPYVACFSNPIREYEKANGLLSLWRGYGSKGVALIFQKEDLLAAMSEEESRYRYLSIVCREVAYFDPDERPSGRTLELCNQISDLTPWAFKVDADNFGLAYPTERATCQPTDRINQIVELFSFTKHASFKEENEFRIVATAITVDHPEAETPKKDVDFRYSNGAVVPYVKLPLMSATNFALKGILVGPSIHQDRLANSIEEFVRIKGLQVKVWRSEIPYISV